MTSRNARVRARAPYWVAKVYSRGTVLVHKLFILLGAKSDNALSPDHVPGIFKHVSTPLKKK